MSKGTGYSGAISNHGAQVVKGPNVKSGAKGGIVKRGTAAGGKSEKGGK